jgi:hypothetical protein
MDKLIALVSEKTGIDAGKARTAVETVLNFLKTKLPEPLAGQLDAAVGGGSGGESGDPVGDAAKKIGGMFSG